MPKPDRKHTVKSALVATVPTGTTVVTDNKGNVIAIVKGTVSDAVDAMTKQQSSH